MCTEAEFSFKKSDVQYPKFNRLYCIENKRNLKRSNSAGENIFYQQVTPQAIYNAVPMMFRNVLNYVF